MSKLSDQKLLSGRAQAIGAGFGVPVPIRLDPVEYEGVLIYGEDQNCYYSDGKSWRIPASIIPISRPSSLVPTDTLTQTQLRLTRFFSSTGEFQAGARFQVSLTGNFETDVLFTRQLAGDDINLYQVLYPDDLLQAGQTFYWRALYIGSEGSQSDYSLPYQQTFPELIATPSPLTREGAIVGSVEVTAFESPSIFGLSYYTTQTEFYSADGTTLITTATHNTGAVTPMPASATLPEGAIYTFRTRYGGRKDAGSAVVYSGWSIKRSFFNGGGSMLLEYDLTQALNRTVNLPLGVYDATGMNVNVNWGDGTAVQNFTTGGIKSHTYAAGIGPIVNVTVSGTLKQFGGNTNQQGLRRVDNWGFKLGLTSLKEALRNTTATLQYVSRDLPTTVTSVSGLFYGATIAVDVTGWDWSLTNVKDLSNFFYGCTTFNQAVGDWNVSTITNLAGVFQGCLIFNQPVGNWNISNVTTLAGTFAGCLKFNQSVNDWKTSKVTDMGGTFAGQQYQFAAYNQPLDNWDTSNVTNMGSMFAYLTSFNQPIGNWNTSKVTNMSGMFCNGHLNTSPFNQPIENWDVSKVTTMNNMFSYTSKFNQPISNWNTASLTDIDKMFTSAASFNQPIGAWDVSKLTSVGSFYGGAFYNAISFNQNLNSWGPAIKRISDLGGLFAGATSYDIDLSEWELNPNGVSFARQYSNFGLPAMGKANYSKTLIGWANGIYKNDGPYGASLGLQATRLYDATEFSAEFAGKRFKNAVAARAFLVGARGAVVSESLNSTANGTYGRSSATQYTNSTTSWYFIRIGNVWQLRDNSNNIIDTSSGNQTLPWLETGWTAALSGATLLSAGAGWTITGDAQA